jgi:hypothetical protein
MKPFPEPAFVPLDPEDRPQDHPTLDGKGWTFRTLEHGGDQPDTMPQAIEATDAEGRSHIYVALEVDGKLGRFRSE